MDVEQIEHEGKKLGYVLRGHLKERGRNFPSQEEDYLQLGFLNLKKGEWVLPHEHKPLERKVLETHKAVYVVSGSMKFHFFDNKKKIKEVKLNGGDLIVLMKGGFGFEALEDGTKIIEIKQGPYPGLEKDKEKFSLEE